MLCLYCNRDIDERFEWRAISYQIVQKVLTILRAAHEACYQEYVLRREGK
jgi:predicted Fe-S protein YdhL (DUF1289 family)